ncbi:MAG: hypothetical protein U0587_15325 [Candidatus Binatia bacterium]
MGAGTCRLVALPLSGWRFRAVAPEKLASLVEAVAAIVDELERSGLDYAIGGAMSYSAWAEPRATRDIDVNKWVDVGRLDEAFDTLARAGVRVDRQRACEDAEHRGMFVGHHGEYRVGVFLPSVPFYEVARRQRRKGRLADRYSWALSPETLAVFKLLCFRPKDLVDVKRLLEIQGYRMDRDLVRQSLVDMLGKDDERIRSPDDLMIEAAPNLIG